MNNEKKNRLIRSFRNAKLLNFFECVTKNHKDWDTAGLENLISKELGFYDLLSAQCGEYTEAEGLWERLKAERRQKATKKRKKKGRK